MFDPDAYSWPIFDQITTRTAELIGPATVLDIGAGSGKYGRLLREALPQARLTALEVDADVAQRNELGAIYDEVINLTAADFMRGHPTRVFDLAIIGDCIEHMTKSEGIDLLNFLTYRSGYTLIITPEAMVMSLEPFYRGHNSVWTERDFSWHDNWAFARVVEMQLFLLRGYLTQSIALGALVGLINAEAMEVTYFDWPPTRFALVHNFSVHVIQKDGADCTFRAQ